VSDAGLSRAGIAAAAVAVPLVAIGGLALLSPLALGRKKRDLEGEGNHLINHTLSALLDQIILTTAFHSFLSDSILTDSKPDAVDRLRARVSDIYTDVVTSDECIERLVCELGGAAKNIYYKDSVIR
jgi:hypothetical protein